MSPENFPRAQEILDEVNHLLEQWYMWTSIDKVIITGLKGNQLKKFDTDILPMDDIKDMATTTIKRRAAELREEYQLLKT